ncbi:MAG: hypothetical protein QW199_03365 [Candidatus Pacearchaeota archaeon]
MNNSLRRGLGFGLTSAVITTLGLIIGLYFSTNSKLVVIAGIIVIAIADGLSDSFGMHISVESEARYKPKYIWQTALATFMAKFFIAIGFLIFVIPFSKNIALILSIIYGLSLIAIFSFHIAKKGKIKPYKVVLEHLIMTVIVIFISFAIGRLLNCFIK